MPDAHVPTCAQDGDDEGGRDALAVRSCIQVGAAAATISHLCVHMEHVRTTRCVGPHHLRQEVQSQSGQQRRRDRRAERSDIAIFFLLLVAIFFLAQQVRPLLRVDGRKGKNITLAFLVLQQIFFLLRLLLLHVFSKWEGGCEMQEGEDT